jgi:hypothetical protein
MPKRDRATSHTVIAAYFTTAMIFGYLGEWVAMTNLLFITVVCSIIPAVYRWRWRRKETAINPDNELSTRSQNHCEIPAPSTQGTCC